jgi:hypothetical protein
MRGRGRVALLLVGGVLSCFSSAQYHREHEQRVAEINKRYDAMRDEQMALWTPVLAQWDKSRQFLIAIKPGAGYSPVERIDALDGFAQYQRTCADVAAEAKNRKGDIAKRFEQLASDCSVKLITDYYLPTLRSYYYKADSEWAIREWINSKGAADIESLFAYSHNTAVLGEIQRGKADAQASFDHALAGIEEMRSAEILGSAQHRDTEISVAHERYRQRMAAIATALQQASQTMARPVPSGSSTLPSGSNMTPTVAVPSYSRTTATTTGTGSFIAPPNGCMSDFSCGIGYTCVKNNYSSTGFCAKAVTSYGNQTFDLPRLDSVGPKMPVSTDCKMLSDCPIGFRCDLRSGACLK